MRNRLLAGVAVGTVLLAGGCGGTTVTAPEPTTPPIASGSPPPLPDESATPSFEPDDVEPRSGPETEFVSQTGRGTLQVVEFAWHEQGADAEAVPPEKSYLVLKLKITCTEGECYHNPAAFRVDSGDGEVTFTGGRDGYGPLLGSGTLDTDDEVEGIVSFDLTQSEATLQFLDEFDDVAGEVEIPE